MFPRSIGIPRNAGIPHPKPDQGHVRELLHIEDEKKIRSIPLKNPYFRLRTESSVRLGRELRIRGPDSNTLQIFAFAVCANELASLILQRFVWLLVNQLRSQVVIRPGQGS